MDFNCENCLNTFIFCSKTIHFTRCVLFYFGASFFVLSFSSEKPLLARCKTLSNNEMNKRVPELAIYICHLAYYERFLFSSIKPQTFNNHFRNWPLWATLSGCSRQRLSHQEAEKRGAGGCTGRIKSSTMSALFCY